jgi:UMP-CMP kinase
MSADLVEIVQNLRTQLGQKGGAALSTLALAFRVNDTKKTGFFTFDEFEAILGKASLFLKRQELTKLFRHFDHEQNEMLNYREFLRAVQGEVPPRRMNMIRMVWDLLSQGQTQIPVQEVIGNFTAQAHPQVLSGEKTEQQIFREFVTNFENAGNVADKISWEAFADFYASISAGVPYNDDYFVKMMETSWGVKENMSDSEVPSALLRKVENVLREKIRQRTKAECSESETLRKAFKQQDLENSGMIGFNDFLYALEFFGIVLEPKVSQALFAAFDCGDGRINYAEFAAALYQGDSMASSYKGIQKTEQAESKRTYMDTASVLISAPTSSAVVGGAKAPRVLFVVGGPGSGKGTQCARIAEEFGFVHLSVGDLLRDELNNPASKVGAEIQWCIKEGKLVPVEIPVGLLQKAMDLYCSQGKFTFLLDGFPRSADNLQGWDAMVGNSAEVMGMLFFSCSQDILQERLLNRGKTSGRADDNLESIHKRFITFNSDSLPVVDTFRKQGCLFEVSAEPSPDEVYNTVRQVISSLK